jgi:hypothetical protein
MNVEVHDLLERRRRLEAQRLADPSRRLQQ